MAETVNLLPCPFCGKEATAYSQCVECTRCLSCTKATDQQHAIAIWNSRTPTSVHAIMSEDAAWAATHRSELADLRDAFAKAEKREQALAAINQRLLEALKAMANRLHQRGDDAYRDYVRQMQSTPCQGWEAKIASGKFGDLELSSHTLGGNLHGQHLAYREAALAISEFASRLIAKAQGDRKGSRQ